MKLEDVFIIKLKARYMVKVFFVKRVDEYSSMGEFNPVTREIKIDDSLSLEDKALTLLHEIIHALSDCFDIELTETQVLKLEKAFNKLYQLNPALKNLMLKI